MSPGITEITGVSDDSVSLLVRSVLEDMVDTVAPGSTVTLHVMFTSGLFGVIISQFITSLHKKTLHIFTLYNTITDGLDWNRSLSLEQNVMYFISLARFIDSHGREGIAVIVVNVTLLPVLDLRQDNHNIQKGQIFFK